MQDSHLCCSPPTFSLGPAVAPHFFISRIATDHGMFHYKDLPRQSFAENHEI